MIKGERIFSIVLILISIAIYYLSLNFETGFVVDAGLGADFFPKVISLVLFGLSGTLLMKSFKKDVKDRMVFEGSTKLVFLVIAIMALYLIVMQIIGYLWATICFLITMLKLFKIKSNVTIVVYATCFSIFIWYMFGRVFNVSLPLGSLFS